jgi:DNA-binding XRE family transcriptional regulator
MTALYPHKVDFGKATIGGLRYRFACGKPVTETSARNLALPYEDIGLRLKAIREHFSDLSQKDWAEKHGFNKTQYNNWEKGARRIPVDAAEALCLAYGLTLDSIYRGRLDGLSENLRKVL